jgi:hypothetical protein
MESILEIVKTTRTQSRECLVHAACPFVIAAAMAVTPLHAAPAPDAQDPNAFKANVSRAAVTTMPAYTVDEAASAKTHTLFMGADIALNLDKDIYHVKDVWGSNWVIDINGRDKEISARQAPLSLKITPGLKLTEVSATVVGFKRTAAYSYANDPSVRLTKGLDSTASINNDLLATAEAAQYKIDTATNKALPGANAFAGTWDQFNASAMQLTAEHAFADHHSFAVTGGTGIGSHLPLPSQSVGGGGDALGLGSASADVNVRALEGVAASAIGQTGNGLEPGGRIVTKGLDAMDIEFDIRSSKPLHNPYVVTMTRFKTPGTRPGMVQNLVYAEALHPIDEHLAHVHFTEEGFPFNYELVDFQMHIYNRGEEVATNIAANRVELTRDEAFEYIKMEYIGAHLKDTLPATPAMGKLPSDLHSRLAQGKYAEAFYVRVTKEGLAYDAYADPACTKRIDDEYLGSVVKRLRFKPALNEGKPVDGVASVDLSRLAI